MLNSEARTTVHVLLIEDHPDAADWIEVAIQEAAREIHLEADVERIDSRSGLDSIILEGRLNHKCFINDIMIYKANADSRQYDDRPHFDWGLDAVQTLLSQGIPRNKILIYTEYPTAIEVEKRLFTADLLDRILAKPAHCDDFKARVAEMMRP